MPNLRRRSKLLFCRTSPYGAVMATSTSSPPSDGTVPQVVRRVTALSRYDLVLAVVPLALVLAAFTGAVSPLSLHATLAAGALVATLAVVDALFVSPPSGSGRGTDR
jgi:hypothetical protein